MEDHRAAMKDFFIYFASADLNGGLSDPIHSEGTLIARAWRRRSQAQHCHVMKMKTKANATPCDGVLEQRRAIALYSRAFASFAVGIRFVTYPDPFVTPL